MVYEPISGAAVSKFPPPKLQVSCDQPALLCSVSVGSTELKGVQTTGVAASGHRLKSRLSASGCVENQQIIKGKLGPTDCLLQLLHGRSVLQCVRSSMHPVTAAQVPALI